MTTPEMAEQRKRDERSAGNGRQLANQATAGGAKTTGVKRKTTDEGSVPSAKRRCGKEETAPAGDRGKSVGGRRDPKGGALKSGGRGMQRNRIENLIKKRAKDAIIKSVRSSGTACGFAGSNLGQVSGYTTPDRTHVQAASGGGRNASAANRLVITSKRAVRSAGRFLSRNRHQQSVARTANRVGNRKPNDGVRRWNNRGKPQDSGERPGEKQTPADRRTNNARRFGKPGKPVIAKTAPTNRRMNNNSGNPVGEKKTPTKRGKSNNSNKSTPTGKAVDGKKTPIKRANKNKSDRLAPTGKPVGEKKTPTKRGKSNNSIKKLTPTGKPVDEKKTPIKRAIKNKSDRLAPTGKPVGEKKTPTKRGKRNNSGKFVHSRKSVGEKTAPNSRTTKNSNRGQPVGTSKASMNRLVLDGSRRLAPTRDAVGEAETGGESAPARMSYNERMAVQLQKLERKKQMATIIASGGATCGFIGSNLGEVGGYTAPKNTAKKP